MRTEKEKLETLPFIQQKRKKKRGRSAVARYARSLASKDIGVRLRLLMTPRRYTEGYAFLRAWSKARRVDRGLRPPNPPASLANARSSTLRGRGGGRGYGNTRMP